MLSYLAGNKTYLLAALGAVLTFAHAMEWIGTDVYNTLLGLVGSGALATLRSGIKNTAAAQTAIVQDDIAVVDAKVSSTAQVVRNVAREQASEGGQL